MNRRYLIAGAVLVGVLVSGVVLARSMKTAPENAAVPQAAGTVGQKSKGAEDAAVEIVEYSDFQCPACRTAQDALRALLAKYPDKVKITFRHFPLAGHQWAAVAHHAAECGNRQGRFWEYQDILFGKQAEWSTPENPTARFIAYAHDAGLDIDAFAACLADPSVEDVVAAEKATGKEMQVSSTPTFFVNGERAVGHIQLTAAAEKIIAAADAAPAQEGRS